MTSWRSFINGSVKNCIFSWKWMRHCSGRKPDCPTFPKRWKLYWFISFSQLIILQDYRLIFFNGGFKWKFDLCTGSEICWNTWLKKNLFGPSIRNLIAKWLQNVLLILLHPNMPFSHRNSGFHFFHQDPGQKCVLKWMWMERWFGRNRGSPMFPKC